MHCFADRQVLSSAKRAENIPRKFFYAKFGYSHNNCPRAGIISNNHRPRAGIMENSTVIISPKEQEGNLNFRVIMLKSHAALGPCDFVTKWAHMWTLQTSGSHGYLHLSFMLIPWSQVYRPLVWSSKEQLLSRVDRV